MLERMPRLRLGRAVTLAGAAVALAAVVSVGLTGTVRSAPAPARASAERAGVADGHVGAPAGEPTSTHPVVATASDPATGGYWVVASDGGVFSFDARFYGSAGALPLARPVVGAASTPDGGGYWLVASDGGVFAFGDAAFHGSTGSMRLNRPVVGMAADPGGGGYWLVASDGGLFGFGDAPFAGAATGLLHRKAVGMAVAAGSGGYRVLSGDGSVYDFGGAPFYGSLYVPPMAGEVVAVDPGHDGGNAGAPGFIALPISRGNGTEPCDTVGTETAAGYSEHAFNFDVAVRLQAILQAEGATVVMTRADDTGVGPCVDARAGIGNAAGADAAVSIHADAGPVSGRGFDVIEPLLVVSPTSDNTGVVPASAGLAEAVRSSFTADTGEPASDYSGLGGIDRRSDLGGLNLTTVPKVLIECADMQNPVDAALTESPPWRQAAARGLADGITAFLAAGQAP